jgi:hypothetical protein
MAEPVRIRIASLGWSASWCDTIIRAVLFAPQRRLAYASSRAFCVERASNLATRPVHFFSREQFFRKESNRAPA